MPRTSLPSSWLQKLRFGTSSLSSVLAWVSEAGIAIASGDILAPKLHASKISPRRLALQKGRRAVAVAVAVGETHVAIGIAICQETERPEAWPSSQQVESQPTSFQWHRTLTYDHKQWVDVVRNSIDVINNDINSII